MALALLISHQYTLKAEPDGRMTYSRGDLLLNVGSNPC
jgi:hypothetical protein